MASYSGPNNPSSKQPPRPITVSEGISPTAVTSGCVHISYRRRLSEELPSLDQFIPEPPLPPGRDIFTGESMQAKGLKLDVRAKVGVILNPDGYSAQHKDDSFTNWLYVGAPGQGLDEKRSLLDSTIKAVGQDKLLQITGAGSFTASTDPAGDDYVDQLARFIANERFSEDANIIPLNAEESGIDEVLDALQEEYLRGAKISHFILSDAAPEGFKFLPSDTEAPRLDDGRKEIVYGARDKVSDRLLAQKIGILKQPKFIDTRDFNQPLPVVHYAFIDLQDFPTDQATLKASQQNRIIIFENLWKGFAIFHLEGKIFVSSFNPIINAMIKEKGLHDPSSLLSLRIFKEFLKTIEGLMRFGTRTLIPDEAAEISAFQHRTFDTAALVELITAHNAGPLYLKSARTAGGKGVLKVWRDKKEGLVVESNSEEVVAKYGERVRILKSFATGLGVANALTESSAKLLTPQQVLQGYAAEIRAPIVEAEIPMAPCNGGRAEARMIYQVNEMGVLERTGAYCKFSTNQVAANVSLGGQGMPVLNAIEHILIAQDVEATQIPVKASTTLQRLQADVDTFANKFREEKGTALDEFAVDVAFVWNEAASQIDFYLIEVQRGFAFEGLRQVDPASAALVEQRRKERLVRAQRDTLSLLRSSLLDPVGTGNSPSKI